MWGEPAAAEASMMLPHPEGLRAFSLGSCPWITGPWQWWAAQAPVRAGVDSDLCLHTGLLVAVAAALASHARLWGPSCQPQLAPISGALLSIALNPLSSRTRKQRGKRKSLASSAAPDLFPDSLLASCGALTPFRLYSRHQPQSSPCNLTKVGASAPRPHPPRWVSRQASRAGEYWLALILCVGISPLCPQHPYCCALLSGSEASPPPPPAVSAMEGASQCVETFPPSQLPPTGAGPIPILLSLLFLFSFALPRYVGSFFPFGKSEVFCQRSVGGLQEQFHRQMYF